jgi:hypothetical protein
LKIHRGSHRIKPQKQEPLNPPFNSKQLKLFREKCFDIFADNLASKLVILNCELWHSTWLYCGNCLRDGGNKTDDNTLRDNGRKRIKMEEHFSLIKHENSKGQSLECDGRLNHMLV